MPDIYLNNLDGIPFGNNSGRPNPQTGQPYFNGQEARLELYTNNGWQNIVQETPSVVNVTGQLNENASSTLTVNGTNFAFGANVFAIGTNSVEYQCTSASIVSVVQISAVFPPLSPAYEPYDIKVVNPSNLYGVIYDAVTVDNVPVWTTASGSLGTYIEQSPMSVSIAATDPVDASSSALVYSISSGALPGGLSINSSTGVISGTPTDIVANTTYNFTAAAYDGRNAPITRNFSISITDRGPSWTTSATLPTFTRNSAYSTTLVATDDNGIASYTLFSGSLPTGLTLNSTTGVISGTPTSSNEVTFTIRATDNGGSFVDRQFTMPNAGPSWSTASTLPTFTGNSAYSTTLVATDDSGNNPSYSIVSGSLPTGLSLNSTTGVISGTPTSSLAVTFTVRATDANGTTADRAFTMPNSGPSWVTTSQTVSGVTNSTSLNFTLSATDDGALTYSVSSGSLPSGLSLNSSTGAITGTTSLNGTQSTTFSVSDQNGNSASGPTITFSFRPAGSFTLSNLPTSYVPGDTIDISYNGSYQTFPKKNATSVRLEVWGAQGGNAGGQGTGGFGGYSVGDYSISGDLYAYIGGQGNSQTSDSSGTQNGGFNGGGNGGIGGFTYGRAPGGGGTDFRTTINSSYQNRVIVAGGGSGGDGELPGQAGHPGGGTTGGGSGGGTQSSAGGGGGFGFGANGGSEPSTGGGGGWYGGGSPIDNRRKGGGSGYIGGLGNASTSSGSRSGNGAAKVTILAT